jgi:cytochrome c peroxidase
MTDVKLIMEVDGSLFELAGHTVMQAQSRFDNYLSDLQNSRTESFREMAFQKCFINDLQRVLIRETDGTSPEVTLVSRINVERTRSRVHGS